jgi:hypothetical protein
MIPQERELLTGLFDRLKQNEPAEKDAEAGAFIRDAIARQPGAAYTLVQAVMVQEHALGEAGQRIQALEKDLAEARAGQPPQPSFLGAKLGSGRPWDRPATAAPSLRPTMVPPPQVQPPQVQAPQVQPIGQPAGGSFMRTALGAAAGFVGGAMLMKGLEGMFGGHTGQAQAADLGAVPLPEAKPEPEAWNPVQEHADYVAGDDSGDAGASDDSF